jgi:hypothetical protein
MVCYKNEKAARVFFSNGLAERKATDDISHRPKTAKKGGFSTVLGAIPEQKN